VITTNQIWRKPCDMGLMWLESMTIYSPVLLKVLDILFNFFARIQVDTVTLFHMGRIHFVQSARWHLIYRCCVRLLCSAAHGPDASSNEFYGSELVPPDGEVSSCWGVSEPNTRNP
jgi:hypothetical protein